MKIKVLLLAVTSVMSLAWSTESFSVYLELQGGNCSDQLTLICRHSDILADPAWIHNGTVESGQLLATAFPGAVYSVQTSTEHRMTISGVDSVRALDGYIIQCVYSILGNITKSNAVKYSFIPPDFYPKLMMTEVVQSFSDRLCTLTYELAGYTEGVAKYPNCADQFSVNFTVSPTANTSNTTTGSIAQYNITNLERCVVYDIFARSYQGGQLMDTVYAVDSVMITPGTFNVSNVTFVSSTVVNITIEEVSSDCPLFPTRWYSIALRATDGASVLRDQVEANSFTTSNGSVTITVLFDTPLPQGMLDVEVFKVVTTPVKELNEEGTPVDTERLEEWSSSNKVTGVFNPHLPPVTTVPSNPVDTGAAVGAGVAAVLFGCCACCICCVVCMCLCFRRRKNTQGYYTIAKPAENMNSYETVSYVLHRSEAEDVVRVEECTNLRALSAATEIHFPDVPLGIADLEDDGVPLFDLVVQTAVDPLKDGLVGETGQTGALQRDGLKQFHKSDKASFNGEEVHSFEESVNELVDEHSSDVPLDKEADIVACTSKVVESTEVVLECTRRPDSPLQEETHSMTSSLQGPPEENTEMTVEWVVTSQVCVTDKGGIKELYIQDGDNSAACPCSQTESDDNAAAVTTKEAHPQFSDSAEVATELLPNSAAGVADVECGTSPLAKAQMANKQPPAAKPPGNVTVGPGLHLSHYAQMDFSKKGAIPAPRSELYNVLYAEMKK